jgi:uncharacterized protein DUF5403
MYVKLINDKPMNKVISRLPGVKEAVWEVTQEIGARATTIRMAHFAEGQAKIEVTQGKVDGHVALVDPNAASIEYGHWLKLKDGKVVRYIPGLYIIHRAAGII